MILARMAMCIFCTNGVHWLQKDAMIVLFLIRYSNIRFLKLRTNTISRQIVIRVLN